MNGADVVESSEIWRRRQVAEFWNVGLSTLDRWVARGHPRLPAPRRNPAGKPFWFAAEVRTAAAAPETADETADDPTPASRSPSIEMSDAEALEILRRDGRRHR